jgi:hypothetical protein
VGPFRLDVGWRIGAAQVSGKPYGCIAYDPTATGTGTCYLDPKYGQSGSVFGLPLAISLAIGDAF